MDLLLKRISLPLAPFCLEVDVEIHGGITAIFGPSGAGKTSLLDLVAGLRRPSSAFIQIGDRVLTDTAQGLFVPTRQRGIGYVPQDLALFPHLSVRQNLRYGRRTNSHGSPQFSFEHIAEVVEIQALIERGVTELSAGEKQRVALARALLAGPQLLLLDEPLASLDLKLKARIIPYLARIRDEFHLPMLYVTHDRFETLALADEMVVLLEGKVAQAGTVQNVFSHPANLALAGIVAIETIQPGRIVKTTDDLATVAVGSATLTALKQAIPENRNEVYVCIRAEDVSLLKGSDHPGSPRNHLPATVISVTPESSLIRVELDCGFRLTALLTREACAEMKVTAGDRVVALLKAPQIHLIPR